MRRPPSTKLFLTRLRVGLHGLLALVLLAGLLWSWSQAQARTAEPLLDESELSHFWPHEVTEAIVATDAHEAGRNGYACIKPPHLKCLAADLILNEIADHQNAQSREELWLAMPQTYPVLEPQPALPYIARQPLLRPPAVLG